MKKISLYLVPLLLTSFASFTQQASCDKCNQRVSVSPYTIEVPRPDVFEAEKHAKLFLPAEAATDYLLDKGSEQDPCLVFFDKTIEPTIIHVADHDQVDENISYKVTTTVTGTGEQSKLVMKVLTTCDGKTIATSEVPFSWNDDAESLQKAGEQAAQKLMPLGEKVKDYAHKLRDADTRYMLNGSGGTIQIKLKNPKLGTGMETEVELQMSDCDGYALKNRKISFAPETVNGLLMPGVQGGVVTPMTVVTDGQGKAKVKFKLTSRNATICAHYTGLNPSGCPDVVFGITQVGAIAVKIDFDFTYQDRETGKSRDESLGVETKLKMYTIYYKLHDIHLLYYPTEPLKKNFSITIPADKFAGEVQYLKDKGVCRTVTTADGNLATFAMGDDLNENQHLIRKFNDKSDPAQHTYLKIDWTASESTSEAQFDFFYKSEDKGKEPNDLMKGDYFFGNTEGASFTKNRITAAGSPYQWEYVIKFERRKKINDDNNSNFGGLMPNYMGSVIEFVTIRIFSPYE